MDDLYLTLLGPLQICRDGQPIGPGASAIKPRALLATLAINPNRVLSKDVLVDRLWDDPPPTARNLVEKYVSLLRKDLDDGRLETVGPGYRLNLETHECDLLEVRDLLTGARCATEAGDHVRAAAALSHALSLWDPAFEEGVAPTLPESDRPWLVDLQLTVLEQWALSQLVSGSEAQPVVAPLTAAIKRHPLRERLTELLMWALCRLGRQHEATTWFEQVRQRLVDELGQDPGESLQQMHLRVLRQDPALLGASRPGSPLDNLPPRNSRFTGRAWELVTIERVLGRATETQRAVAIWGLVGAGKSALALEYGYRARGVHYDCIWWIDASTRASTVAELELLAGRLGTPLPADREPSLHCLWDALQCFGRALLIFDNATSMEELAVDYLPPGNVSDVLITSLNPEWRRVAEPLAIDVLSPEDAVSLLRNRIGPGDAGAEGDLIAALGRLPLAMGQAAAYIEQTGMSLEQYLPLFHRRRSQLLQRGVPDDHRGTIDATWRLAQAELSATHPVAVHLLAMCSLLASENIPLDLVRSGSDKLPTDLRDAVLDELALEDAIRQMRRFSLVTRHRDRLQMHCLVQTVITSSLMADVRNEWIARVSALLVDFAPSTFEDRDTWPRWEVVAPHVCAVASSARGVGRSSAAFVDLVQRTSHYLAGRAAFSEALTLMQDAQALIEAAAPAPDHVSVGRGLTVLGTLLERCGQVKEALTVHEQGLAILQRHGDAEDPWVARALGALGSVLTCHSGISLWRPDELDDAEARFARALDVLQTAWGTNHPAVASALAGLGQVRQDRGDFVGGRQCQESALDILEALYGPDHPEVGDAYDKLGYVLALEGKTDRSAECFEHAGPILARAYGDDHVNVAWLLSNFATLLTTTSHLDEALAKQEQAHAIFVRNDPSGAAVQISAWRLARIHAAAGRYEECLDLLYPAIEDLRAVVGDQNGDVLAMRADLVRVQFHLQAARR